MFGIRVGNFLTFCGIGFAQLLPSLNGFCQIDVEGERLRNLRLQLKENTCTVLVLRMAHRKWKEFKQKPSMLPGSAVPGSCLVSVHFLWAILSTSTVYLGADDRVKWTPKPLEKSRQDLILEALKL